MVAYSQFLALTQSGDGEARGRAAQMAALAYLRHDGPADEQAALYGALIGFLDDPSVKVRAALAYGLLHAVEAPRPIILALLQDVGVIARAVAQYAPVLVDADLIAVIRNAAPDLLAAVAMRTSLGPRVIEALMARRERPITLRLLRRTDISIDAAVLSRLATDTAEDAGLRGALLERGELPPAARLRLVEAAGKALRETRIVAGAIAPQRLERLMRNATDSALTAIGERAAALAQPAYAAAVVEAERVSTRVLLHAVVNGHVLFFADCLTQLSEVPGAKVRAILEAGSRGAINALLVRCGLGAAVREILVRLVLFARDADLADDAAARHYVVTALTEELLIEHDGVIPPDLEDAFCYLSEQNVALARRAARGVMAAFAEDSHALLPLPADPPDYLALPAA